MPRVVHFEISADKPERAIKFYEKVFGWEIRKWKGPVEYWLIVTGKEDEPGMIEDYQEELSNAALDHLQSLLQMCPQLMNTPRK